MASAYYRRVLSETDRNIEPRVRDDGDIRVRNSVMNRLMDSSQICHHPKLKGRRETHLCLGARDWQLTILHRMGFIPQPTDEAFAQRSREFGCK